jgi:outer membrane protein TolC
MRHRNFLVFLVILAACLLVIIAGRLAWGAETRQELTLDRALDLSAESNPLVMAAAARVKQAEGRLIQARSDGLPQVYGSLGYQKLQERPETLAFSLVDGKTPIGIVPLGFEETNQAAVNLTQVLFSGGSLTARTEAARLLLAAARSERDRTLQAVDNGVRRAFYALQRSVSRLEVAREALYLAKEHLRQVESFFRAGVVAQNEVMRVQVAVSSAELNRIRAESAVEVAWKTLERFVGQSLQEHYSVTAGDPELEAFSLAPDPIAKAMELRPELKGLEAARRAALETLKAVKGQAYPQVGLQAQASLADEHFFPSEKDDWSVGIVARLRLFDSGKLHGQAVEARATATELLNRLEDLKRQVALEVATARVLLDGAVQSVKVASDAVVQSEEDYRMALKRYQAQVGTNIDVLDARLALTDARNALADAVAEARTAYGDLLFAMGEIPGQTNKEVSR